MKFWILIKEFLSSIFGNILYFISLFVPKNQNIWIFGGLLGEGYSDNCKYFFEYINANKKNIQAIWISQNPTVVNTLTQNGYKAYLGYSLNGLWLSMQAGVAVISHSRVRDLKPFVVTPHVKFVQLWHGIPLKKIEFDDNVFFNKPSLANRIGFFIMKILSPAFRRKFDMFIACSREDQKNFASAFRLDIDKIKITGYPRNDAMINSNQIKKKADDKINILYVPTFRGIEKSKFNLLEKFKFDFIRMDAFLQKHKMTLSIKLHPYNQPNQKFLQNLQETKNIKFYDAPDIYTSLCSFDILITDFSSIYFDYLLLDKPVLFAPFDMDTYLKNDRDLYYNYDEITPGPKAENWIEMEALLSQLSEQPETYESQRQEAKEKFHFYKDADSSERIYQHIIQLT